VLRKSTQLGHYSMVTEKTLIWCLNWSLSYTFYKKLVSQNLLPLGRTVRVSLRMLTRKIWSTTLYSDVHSLKRKIQLVSWKELKRQDVAFSLCTVELESRTRIFIRSCNWDRNLYFWRCLGIHWWWRYERREYPWILPFSIIMCVKNSKISSKQELENNKLMLGKN